MQKLTEKISVYLDKEMKDDLIAIGNREGQKLSNTIRKLLLKAMREYRNGEL